MKLIGTNLCSFGLDETFTGMSIIKLIEDLKPPYRMKLMNTSKSQINAIYLDLEKYHLEYRVFITNNNGSVKMFNIKNETKSQLRKENRKIDK